MNKLTSTSHLILNYFVPFTSGKFIATCLMFSKDVCPMISQGDIINRLSADTWANVEYSDQDFWWKDKNVDWFNSTDWYDNLNVGPIDAINTNLYCFYTCHETHTVHYLKKIFPKAQVLMILPNYELCRKNYLAKNWVETESIFEESRVYKELIDFNPIDTNLVFDQRHIYDSYAFLTGILDLARMLKINLDVDRVLEYRECYLNSKFNR